MPRDIQISKFVLPSPFPIPQSLNTYPHGLASAPAQLGVLAWATDQLEGLALAPGQLQGLALVRDLYPWRLVPQPLELAGTWTNGQLAITLDRASEQ